MAGMSTKLLNIVESLSYGTHCIGLSAGALFFSIGHRRISDYGSHRWGRPKIGKVLRWTSLKNGKSLENWARLNGAKKSKFLFATFITSGGLIWTSGASSAVTNDKILILNYVIYQEPLRLKFWNGRKTFKGNTLAQFGCNNQYHL